LHGKVSVLGLAAALQVLLGLQGRGEETCDRPPDPAKLRAHSPHSTRDEHAQCPCACAEAASSACVAAAVVPCVADRVEVAALLTFCSKLSAACELVHRFEEMDTGKEVGVESAAAA
jgi:hypothetical protein